MHLLFKFRAHKFTTKLLILSFLVVYEKVSMPFLILHGEADIVTNPSVSKALYEKASSKDKKLLLCKDSYYAILEGEPDDVIERVFGDIISWLDEHSTENAAQS